VLRPSPSRDYRVRFRSIGVVGVLASPRRSGRTRYSAGNQRRADSAARCTSHWRIPAPRVSISSCAARLNQAGIESRHPATPAPRSSIGGFDARNQQLLCSAPASHPRSSLLAAGRLQAEVGLSHTLFIPFLCLDCYTKNWMEYGHNKWHQQGMYILAHWS